jgi:hypothetical protein
MSAKKVEIYSPLVPALEQLMERFPGQASNLTAVVNSIIELYTPAYEQLLGSRTINAVHSSDNPD